jgi:hypothetical protein
MKLDLDQDEVTVLLRALEDYHAYLVSQQRQDPRYPALIERLANSLPATNANRRKGKRLYGRAHAADRNGAPRCDLASPTASRSKLWVSPSQRIISREPQ